MNTARDIGLVAGLVIALGLGACAGGSNDDERAMAGHVAEVPDSASASSAALAGYILGPSRTDETSEPSIIKGSFALPADESGDPQPLI